MRHFCPHTLLIVLTDEAVKKVKSANLGILIFETFIAKGEGADSARHVNASKLHDIFSEVFTGKIGPSAEHESPAPD